MPGNDMDDLKGKYVEHSVLGIGCICETYIKNRREYIVVEFADGGKKSFSADNFFSHFKTEDDESVKQQLQKNRDNQNIIMHSQTEKTPEKNAEVLQAIVAWLHESKNYTVFYDKNGKVEFALNIDDSHQNNEETVVNRGKLTLLSENNCVHFEYHLVVEDSRIFEIYFEADPYLVYEYQKLYDLISTIDKKTNYTFFPHAKDMDRAGVMVKKNLFTIDDFFKIEKFIYTFCTTSSGLFPYYPVVEVAKHDLGYKDFIIIANAFLCIKEHHTMEKILAFIHEVLPDGSKKKVSTFALYCKDCNEYYIKTDDYEKLKQHHPVLLIRAVSEKKHDNINSESRFDNYAMTSVLKQCGYSVSQSENLSPKQRRIILENMIDGGIWTYEQTVNHLEWNIEKDGTERNRLARSKWREDIQYLKETYYLNAREVGIRSIKYR